MCVANSIIVDDHSNEINNHKVIRVFVAKKGNYSANPETSDQTGPSTRNLSIIQFFNLSIFQSSSPRTDNRQPKTNQKSLLSHIDFRKRNYEY